MIRSILLMFLLVCFQFSFAQKVNLSKEVLATAGNGTEITNSNSPINISKWRIGEIYLVTLTDTDLQDNSLREAILNVYPNPFSNEVSIELKTENTDVYKLLITDISGRQQYYNSEKTIIPGQPLQINLSNLRPAMYILTLQPSHNKNKWMVKIQKQ